MDLLSEDNCTSDRDGYFSVEVLGLAVALDLGSDGCQDRRA
jgi:hypothetical protein